MNNITLIGMPAVGKSTVGVILAKLLAMDFLDTDLCIQRREGRPLGAIIAEKGLDGFLAIEDQVCASIHVQNTVIATGGSVVYGEAAMERLKSLGIVVFLDVAYEILESRLRDLHGRGVVIRPGQTLRELYEERTPLYRKYADIVVAEGAGGIEETVEGVLQGLRGETGNCSDDER